jgi:hypothetical protein
MRDSSPLRRRPSFAPLTSTDQPEEIGMNKHNGRVSIRKAVEKTFAALIAAAILTFIVSGTYAMCVPTAALA